ncbi:MAG: GTPase Era [Candidatus Berkiellales bacterium]
MTVDNGTPTRCGFVAIVGRPNVGKSSLLNAILGKKISITCFKPQTTRHQILGIKTEGDHQTVYVDTPGLHLGAKKALNRQMNRTAKNALIDVNAVIFMVEALKWTAEDEMVCQMLQTLSCPIIIAINKVDLVPNKERLLPFLQELTQYLPQAKVVPISVKKKYQIKIIEEFINPLLPESEFYFPPDQIMSQNSRFYIAEMIREKLMHLLEKEIPYALTVEIEKCETQQNMLLIHALIWTEREGQKSIIIGANGNMLKEVGSRARADLERHFEQKVCLKLWVKVKESWSDDVRALQSLGYVE